VAHQNRLHCFVIVIACFTAIIVRLVIPIALVVKVYYGHIAEGDHFRLNQGFANRTNTDVWQIALNMK
jgi:hypothetical protein